MGISIFHRFNARRSLLGLAVGMFGLTAAVACTGLEGLDAAAAEAIIQNVDSLSGEVTVEFKDGTTATFNLKDVDVEALSQLIGDASLQVGDEIEVELDASNRVSAVTPHIANIHAMIVEVDTDANTMLIEAQNGVQLLLTLTAETKVDLDDHEQGTVQQLLAGMIVKVKFDTETDEALKIKNDADDDDDDENEIKGVITAISAEDHTISIEGENGIVETYTVLSDTEIKIHGRAPFGELEVGMLVELEFDDELALSEIEVKLDDDDEGRGSDDDDGDQHELKGVITAIDPDTQSITVESLEGVVETYSVNSETEIEIRGDVPFVELEVGMQVKIQFETDSLVLNEVKVRTTDGAHDEDDD